MLKKNFGLAICFMLAACGGPVATPTETVDPAEALARDLIETLGPQQTFAMLGWQQNPGYKPTDECFEHWDGVAEPKLSEEAIDYCEAHVQDLSRLYASYDVDAKPVLFKSEYYWAQKSEFDLAFPELVKAWEANGGTEDDASFLEHPVCAKPLQKGWTGSDYFYDGREHPICRLRKIEALEALESKESRQD